MDGKWYGTLASEYRKKIFSNRLLPETLHYGVRTPPT